jgi:predicted HTH domain antitoxin
MLIELPDEILRKPGYGRDELMLDIAVMLYQRKQFSLGKAAKLAKQNRLEFQRTLAERGIEIIYDLDIDLDTLHAAGLNV